jgi:hypothetical protein
LCFSYICLLHIYVHLHIHFFFFFKQLFIFFLHHICVNLIRQWHFNVNKMIHVTQVCSNKFIMYSDPYLHTTDHLTDDNILLMCKCHTFWSSKVNHLLYDIHASLSLPLYLWHCFSLLVLLHLVIYDLINDMKMEMCIFFAPNKNKRNCCSFNPHTSHGRRSIFINIHFSPLFMQANLGGI